MAHCEKVMRQRLDSTFPRAYAGIKKTLRKELITKMNGHLLDVPQFILYLGYDNEKLGGAEEVAQGYQRSMARSKL